LPAGVFEYERIRILHEYVFVQLEDLKHIFLCRGSVKEAVTERGSERYRTYMMPVERMKYKQRAQSMREYLDEILSWAETIDGALEVEKEKA
jgi:hypothetical protein